jgi:hypothetical protein
MNSEALILIGTLGGALIGALSTLGVTWLNKRSEERKHYRELIINLAVENYKEAGIMARAMLERRPDISQIQYPLDDFIIRMVQLGELIIDKKLNPTEIKDILAKMDALTDQVHEYYDTREEARRIKNAETQDRV